MIVIVIVIVIVKAIVAAFVQAAGSLCLCREAASLVALGGPGSTMFLAGPLHLKNRSVNL